jgi:hypothetical protein
MKRGTVQKLSYFSSRLRKNVDIMWLWLNFYIL